eukprot:289499-Rhodomonas_salina.1
MEVRGSGRSWAAWCREQGGVARTAQRQHTHKTLVQPLEGGGPAVGELGVRPHLGPHHARARVRGLPPARPRPPAPLNNILLPRGLPQRGLHCAVQRFQLCGREVEQAQRCPPSRLPVHQRHASAGPLQQTPVGVAGCCEGEGPGCAWHARRASQDRLPPPAPPRPAQRQRGSTQRVPCAAEEAVSLSLSRLALLRGGGGGGGGERGGGR